MTPFTMSLTAHLMGAVSDSIPHVLGLRVVSQIAEAVVEGVTIVMTGFHTVGPWTNKR